MIIPALNEVKSLPKVLSQIPSEILDYNFSSNHFMNLLWEIRFNMPGFASNAFVKPKDTELRYKITYTS